MNYEIFKDKKILIFLPHQDDEINTIYGLLYGIKNIAKSIKIIYSTNGNSVVAARYRLKEGINSLKKVGILKENIIFLGYSDQIPEADNHLYQENDCWIDNKNNYLTNTPYSNDYHFLKFKEHAKFNKENMINDVYNILKEEVADILFCIDFDTHPDHRALSLSFENALGSLMKEIRYEPLVYKMFAYPTSYKGLKDFNYNNPSTKFNCEENSFKSLQNPYYNWNNRERFIQPNKATKYLLLNNIYYWGLLQHNSQYILNRVEQIINSDMIFFKRITNNLLYRSNIETSSGNAEYLNDFMLFDISKVMNTDLIVFDCGYTNFSINDNNKIIKIKFKDKVSFDSINIYVKENNNYDLNYIIIKNNNVEIEYRPIINNNILCFKNLDYQNIDELEIKLILNKNIDFNISEIEIFKQKQNIKYGKLIINDDFIYNYYFKCKPNVNIYSNCDKKDLKLEEKKIGKDYIITLKTKDNEILDKINLKYISIIRKNLLKIVNYINLLTIFFGRVYQKIVKELRKVMK